MTWVQKKTSFDFNYFKLRSRLAAGMLNFQRSSHLKSGLVCPGLVDKVALRGNEIQTHGLAKELLKVQPLLGVAEAGVGADVGACRSRAQIMSLHRKQVSKG